MSMICNIVCPPNPAVEMAKPPILCGCDLPWQQEPIPPGAPLRESAVQTAANQITVTFNQALATTPPPDPAAFTVALVGVPGITVTTATISGSTVVLGLSAPATFTVGTTAYLPTGTGDLKALDDNSPVAPYSGYGVTPM
jgi:hypothetical protein